MLMQKSMSKENIFLKGIKRIPEGLGTTHFLPHLHETSKKTDENIHHSFSVAASSHLSRQKGRTFFANHKTLILKFLWW